MEEAKTFEPMHPELSEEAKISRRFFEYCMERGLSNHDIGLIGVVTTGIEQKADEEEDCWFDKYACLNILYSLTLMGEDVLTVFRTIATWMLEFKNEYDIRNDDFDKAYEELIELVDYIEQMEKFLENEKTEG